METNLDGRSTSSVYFSRKHNDRLWWSRKYRDQSELHTSTWFGRCNDMGKITRFNWAMLFSSSHWFLMHQEHWSRWQHRICMQSRQISATWQNLRFDVEWDYSMHNNYNNNHSGKSIHIQQNQIHYTSMEKKHQILFQQGLSRTNGSSEFSWSKHANLF